MISCFLGLIYAMIMLFYCKAWQSIPSFYLSDKANPQTKISVLIPARNESDCISSCIESILAQSYGNFELLVINDHSTDDTAAKILNYRDKRVKLIESEAGFLGKKAALSTGISTAVNKLIVTSDADCEYHEDWLKTIAACYEEMDWRMIAAPVVFHRESSFLERFQALDFSGMILIGAASLKSGWGSFANGANFIYEKSFFHELGGFAGNESFASGDDVFLMEKAMKVSPEQVGFLKSSSATVKTLAARSWTSFLQQRIRWGSKTQASKNVKMLAVAIFVFGFNIYLLALFIASFFWSVVLGAFLIAFGCKMLSDFLLLSTACTYFQRRNLLWLFLAAQPLHIVYIVWAGILANFSTYTWKGRKLG